MRPAQITTPDGVRLTYTDTGGDGPALLCLHGHFSRASTFAPLAASLPAHWRVVALDQRGHGESEAPEDYSRAAYLRDAAAAIEQLGLAPAVVLGHSLGGVNAYQLAARRPELVRALIVEDIGAVVDVDFEPFLAGWPERFPSRETARAFLAERVPGGESYFLASLFDDGQGWRFRFRYDHMIRSQRATNGDWWSDWEASRCPALLIHGRKSWGLATSDARAMAARRPGTLLMEFADCGHVVHDDDPAGFARAVDHFLQTL